MSQSPREVYICRIEMSRPLLAELPLIFGAALDPSRAVRALLLHTTKQRAIALRVVV